jgi:large subunit ribosomal protein L15
MARIHKRKKCSRYHGRGMGSCGGGARKKRKKSGHKGGIGMAGSGKRADHKRTLTTKLYGNTYFGKQGITSRGTKRDVRKRIDLKDIELNLEGYIKKGLAKKSGNKIEINLEDYKILGKLDSKIVLIIKALEASEGAIKSVKSAGGEIIIKKKENKEIESE